MKLSHSRDVFLLGAVAYDPKVVTIWEGFRTWFQARGFPFDYVLFSHYERQVQAQLDRVIDVAWNSPLAWVETERAAARHGLEAHAIAMRDTDQDLESVVVVRTDSPVQSLADLRGKTVAVGALDSPQATLIPLHHIATATGMEPGRDFAVRRNDLLVGLHGDHVGGEREAARQLVAGEVDACCIIDGNHLAFAREGTFPPGRTRILSRTAPYDHCCFSVLGHALGPRVEQFTELLLSQRYDDPDVRHLLDLEGLKQWRAGRTTGFAQLRAAVDRFGLLERVLGELRP